ncbi:unnamed protein product [Rangifer tarandus platyrhynchus]|uniref:Uncharacterized protein n=2 Tax=Rangifer tarandus platyrhynchus TaxID=3082113 RepID=A0ABN8YRV2_RANTA|nr:unnamed protein product [Rangifer tarandus platyrhynchus]CAI9700483.1 unnamed protein product [Rangifer tarandus platyrhynchus]
MRVGPPTTGQRTGPRTSFQTSAGRLDTVLPSSSSVIGWRRADSRGSAVPGPGFPGSEEWEARGRALPLRPSDRLQTETGAQRG